MKLMKLVILLSLISGAEAFACGDSTAGMLTTGQSLTMKKADAAASKSPVVQSADASPNSTSAVREGKGG
jgi:hypothetical protein